MGRDAIEGPTLRMVDLVGDKKKGIAGYLNLSRSSIYGKMDPTSKSYDPTFPRSIQLGAKSIGWRKADIDAWQASRPTTQPAGTRGDIVPSIDPPEKSRGKSARDKNAPAADTTRPKPKVVQKKEVSNGQGLEPLPSANNDQNLTAMGNETNSERATSAKANSPNASPAKRTTFAEALGKTVESAVRGTPVRPTDLKKVAKRMVKLATGGKG